MGMGFPLFHYYQHLPHLSIALVHGLTLGVFALADMLNWTTYLLLSLSPFPFTGHYAVSVSINRRLPWAASLLRLSRPTAFLA